jgi:hypothetical protein
LRGLGVTRDHGVMPSFTESQYVPALMSAAPGTVRIHAQTMRLATPQRTAESFYTEPATTMLPVMV